MASSTTRSLTPLMHEAARALTGAPDDFDAVLALIGEASHGTHEFYRIRAEITKRLIREQGFTAVAAEADWPDAYRVNRYVRGAGGDADASEALSDFRRFPQWMWRNADVLDFVGWLREHNDELPRDAPKVGFYGLDLNGRIAPDDLFFAEQNAQVVRNAERYYRAMFGSRVSSWNLRDQHMADTLSSLASFLDTAGRRSRIVVWAHNSRVGDARATELGARGELDVGQLVRQQYDRDAVLLGFTYFHARLPMQFDAILHYDVTRAVEPLERSGLWERGELPETFPSAL